jgi:hypothetical protein
LFDWHLQKDHVLLERSKGYEIIVATGNTWISHGLSTCPICKKSIFIGYAGYNLIKHLGEHSMEERIMFAPDIAQLFRPYLTGQEEIRPWHGINKVLKWNQDPEFRARVEEAGILPATTQTSEDNGLQPGNSVGAQGMDFQAWDILDSEHRPWSLTHVLFHRPSIFMSLMEHSSSCGRFLFAEEQLRATLVFIDLQAFSSIAVSIRRVSVFVLLWLEWHDSSTSSWCLETESSTFWKQWWTVDVSLSVFISLVGVSERSWPDDQAPQPRVNVPEAVVHCEFFLGHDLFLEIAGMLQGMNGSSTSRGTAVK